MFASKTVRVSEHFQITIPRTVCDQLKIQYGDRLLIHFQGGMLILLPQPQSYASQLAGLHRETWEGVDTENTLVENV